MRNTFIIFTLFICFNSYSQSRSPAVEPVLTLVNEEEKPIAPNEAKGFDFRIEENEIVNIEALLKNVSQGNEQIPLAVTILFLMLTPAIISVSILGMVKNLERESDLEILFEEEFPQEAPISLDEYRKSKQKEEDFRKAG